MRCNSSITLITLSRCSITCSHTTTSKVQSSNGYGKMLRSHTTSGLTRGFMSSVTAPLILRLPAPICRILDFGFWILEFSDVAWTPKSKIQNPKLLDMGGNAWAHEMQV